MNRDRKLGDLGRFQERAFDLLTSTAAQNAFRIDKKTHAPATATAETSTVKVSSLLAA